MRGSDRPQVRQEEQELVERMRAGEARAYEEFAQSYIPGLYRFACRRLGNDRELTRDLVQATVCKVVEKLDTFRAEAPLFTWLCACCRNEIAGHFRRLDRRPREVELEESDANTSRILAFTASARPGPEERLLLGETSDLVHLTLDRLPASYAQVLEWRYLEELAVPEIARRMASSYKAAESLLARARSAFRAHYDDLAGESRAESVGREFPEEGARG